MLWCYRPPLIPVPRCMLLAAISLLAVECPSEAWPPWCERKPRPPSFALGEVTCGGERGVRSKVRTVARHSADPLRPVHQGPCSVRVYRRVEVGKYPHAYIEGARHNAFNQQAKYSQLILLSRSDIPVCSERALSCRRYASYQHFRFPLPPSEVTPRLADPRL
ncbi:hypothetical protein B0H67DRAFT_36394 [Lasiosphaeris hirsuta]|uniref:Secreted protein n=1 Tax=Lasiosphaeris hirsuta TaxID=260670 RepID=A0AA40BA63_9PEZI|nr:hypothetical protein B0H67DRAFT_36394 [Lasiosphaeris hirsuta]